MTALTIEQAGGLPPAYPTEAEALRHASPLPTAGCDHAKGADACTPTFTIAAAPPKSGQAWRFGRWVSTDSQGFCMDAKPREGLFPCNRPGPEAWRVDARSMSRVFAAGPVAYETAAEAKQHLLPVPEGCRDPAGAIVCTPSFWTETASNPTRVMWRPSLWVPSRRWGACVDEHGNNPTRCVEPAAGFERVQTASPPPPPPLILNRRPQGPTDGED